MTAAIWQNAKVKKNIKKTAGILRPAVYSGNFITFFMDHLRW